MASLADGDMTPAEYDRVARALRDHPEFEGLEWDWVVHRSRELAEDAPLFFETRQALPSRLADPRARRRAIAIAARAMGAERNLADEARAVLGSVAATFGLSDGETEQLIQAWRNDPQGPEAYGFVRSDFNDPVGPGAKDVAEALDGAEDDTQRRLLLFKLAAARHLQWQLRSEGPVEILRLGERLRFSEDVFRVDALFERGGRRFLTRFLSSGEALHRREHPILRILADRLPETAVIVIAHVGGLSPEDASFLEGFDPERVWRLRLAADVLPAQVAAGPA